ncbi:MAG: hypothetical protein ACREI9_04240 [Nitrospiraceae bacterium]
MCGNLKTVLLVPVPPVVEFASIQYGDKLTDDQLKALKVNVVPGHEYVAKKETVMADGNGDLGTFQEAIADGSVEPVDLMKNITQPGDPMAPLAPGEREVKVWVSPLPEFDAIKDGDELTEEQLKMLGIIVKPAPGEGVKYIARKRTLAAVPLRGFKGLKGILPLPEADLSSFVTEADMLPPGPERDRALASAPLLPFSDDEVEALGLPKVIEAAPGAGAAHPVFALDEERFPDSDDIELDPVGHSPSYHAAQVGPRGEPSVEGVADEVFGLFNALLNRGFSRNEALDLCKEVVRVRAEQ